MTGSKCLLDTSIIIHAFKNNGEIAAQLDLISEIYVPVIVVGELHYGAYKSANPQKHISQVQAFLQNCKILGSDSGTAEMYGDIKAILMKKGKPIPENDIWIAAVARQYNIPLFTADNHFSEIETISLFR
jgi:tRNA(fMet)-specific endonuclease VapC